MSTTQQAGENFSVYLDNNRIETEGAGAKLFQNPVHMIVAESSGDITAAFNEMQKYLADGYYLAGWVSYETGLFLEGKLTNLGQDSYAVPFLSFGVYENCQSLTAEESEAHWATMSASGGYGVDNLRLNVSRAEYEAAFSKIHEYLMAGDVYQVNFTLKSLFDFTGLPEAYFAAMRKAQKVEYAAFITSDELSVLSLSPELFFRKEGRKITVRPMKGTCARGRTVAEDKKNSDFMRNDEKNRAENLMIVDLLRNDLTKISTPASVKVKSLYDMEKYRTLFQMTSTIESEAPEGMDMVDMLKVLFPCGSVTGAPKIRAMEVIAELEKGSRGIYTGAIGYMGPNGEGCFSVPIRTVTIDHEGRGEMGIGSAIVADSHMGSEFDECLLKAEFATRNFKDFHLIESLRWSGEKAEEGYDLLTLHMNRLKSSAQYFDFTFDEQAIREDLKIHASCLDPLKIWKVRLLLSSLGQYSIVSTAIESHKKGERRFITLSENRVNSRNAMLFHKTTDRKFYDQELGQHQKKHDSYDVLFVNEKGELTEGAYNNIFLKQGEILYTPCLTSGLLNGTLRQSLMMDSDTQLEEKCLMLSDLQQADSIYMGNSVRGLVEVRFNDVS
ncbi:MAG: aminodeoxychorismate synthase component I [Emcibacter sp.]|nr:aminodeoxychorismate synthase component I [Emcibacter sp.]